MAGGTTPAAEQANDATLGWYLYGITRAGLSAARLRQSLDASLEVLEDRGVAAVVRRVQLNEYSQQALEQRVRSMTEVEALVQAHHAVIEAVHGYQAILPAKFGMVYTHGSDILAALRGGSDDIVRQLAALEGSDEWAIHLYANPAVIRERIAATDPEIQGMRAECALARPGRAYFLERQLNARLANAAQEALFAIAQEAFDQLESRAAAGHLSSPASSAGDAEEVEILRAAFLVEREEVEQFAEEVHACTAAIEGLRVDCTGPWPPYSFAARDSEGAA